MYCRGCDKQLLIHVLQLHKFDLFLIWYVAFSHVFQPYVKYTVQYLTRCIAYIILIIYTSHGRLLEFHRGFETSLMALLGLWTHLICVLIPNTTLWFILAFDMRIFNEKYAFEVLDACELSLVIEKKASTLCSQALFSLCREKQSATMTTGN